MNLQPPEPRQDPYPLAERLWTWTGVVFFSWPILADLARPRGIGELRDAGTFDVMFMAIAAITVLAWKRDDAARSRWMGIAAGLTVSAAVVVELADLHIAWQGRMLGYAFLLFATAHFGPKIRDISDRAPGPAIARMKWYMGVLGLEGLAITMSCRLGRWPCRRGSAATRLILPIEGWSSWRSGRPRCWFWC
jgi:hypothetical protein